MIPQAFINEWRQQVLWQTNEQVEQDLVICRAQAEIFSDEWLASSLAFRGGTTLHKLYMNYQPRYSEDIDLVQIRAESIKETVIHLQKALSFLGESSVAPRRDGIRVISRFESEFPPKTKLRLKVEVNTREHFSVFGYTQIPFDVDSTWFSGNCNISSYRLEELLGTKLRALYKRKKGRDLFDLHAALVQHPNLDVPAILHSYREYMKASVGKVPSQKEFTLNLQAKIHDTEFSGDTHALLRPQIAFNTSEAYELLRTQVIELM